MKQVVLTETLKYFNGQDIVHNGQPVSAAYAIAEVLATNEVPGADYVKVTGWCKELYKENALAVQQEDLQKITETVRNSKNYMPYVKGVLVDLLESK